MNLLIVDIVAGAIDEGDTLSREADLAAEFGVSRGVVREALRGLEERGMVVVKHGRGTTVTPARQWNVIDSDVLSVLLQTGARAGVLAEFLECRRILEIEAAGLAAERADPQDIAGLADALAQMETAAARANVHPAADAVFYEADIQFHRAIMAAAGNRVLSRLTEPVQRALFATRMRSVDPAYSHDRGVAEHRRVLAAIADHDVSSARTAMSDHLTTVETILQGYAKRVAEQEEITR